MNTPQGKIMLQVWEGKLWKGWDENGDWVFDINQRIRDREKIINIMKTTFLESRKQENSEFFKSSISTNEGLEFMKEGAAKVVEVFVSEKLISDTLLTLVNKIMPWQNLEITDSDKNYGFVLNDGYLNDKQEKESRVEMPKNVIQSWAEVINKFAGESHLKLTATKAWYLAAVMTAIHEWAHCLEIAIETKVKETTDNDPNYEKICNEIIFRCGGNRAHPVFENFSDQKGRFGPIMHLERFATGFGLLAVEELVKMENINFETTNNFMQSFYNWQEERLRDLQEVRRTMNLPDQDFENYTRDLVEVAQDEGIYSGEFYVPWSDLGYLAPYTREELKFMVNEGWKVANSKELLRQELENEKKCFDFGQTNSLGWFEEERRRRKLAIQHGTI